MTPRMAPIVAAALTALLFGATAAADAVADPGGPTARVQRELPGPTPVSPAILAATAAPAGKASTPATTRIAKPTTAQKPVSKKTTEKKAVVKKTTEKKAVVKKTTAKKAVVKKAVVKKTVVKKTVTTAVATKTTTAARLQPQARKTKPPKDIAPDPHFNTNPAKVPFEPDLKGYPEPLVKAFRRREREQKEG